MVKFYSQNRDALVKQWFCWQYQPVESLLSFRSSAFSYTGFFTPTDTADQAWIQQQLPGGTWSARLPAKCKKRAIV